MEHVAIMDHQTINMILNDEKGIESRFSKNRITPFNIVKAGDIVYLKEPGKDISACFIIKKVLFFDNLDNKKIQAIKDKYDSLIKAPDIYWQVKQNSRYGTLMYIEQPKRIEPIKIFKKNRQGFVSYNSKEGVLCQKKN